MLAGDDFAVHISMDQLVSHLKSQTHALLWEWQSCCVTRPKVKNKARPAFIQARLTTAVKSKMILSFENGCRRKMSSPSGPFRKPLSGCQDSVPPCVPPIYSRPGWMNSSQADVKWGYEVCDTGWQNPVCKILSITRVDTKTNQSSAVLLRLNILFFFG